MRMCACRGTAGFAHVSCLEEQAKILVAEANENHSDDNQWHRWHTCGLCEQRYHGVVYCALGWACWKTYLGRPETHTARSLAMTVLGSSLRSAGHYEDALSVQEAHYSILRRIGASESNILAPQGNLANTYAELGRLEEALSMRRDVYASHLKIYGDEHPGTLLEADNYANDLLRLQRFEEAKSLMLKMMPVARRVLEENHQTTIRMRWFYARALYEDADATLDDFREAVNMFEDLARTARRVFGGSHPLTTEIEQTLRTSRAALRARETH